MKLILEYNAYLITEKSFYDRLTGKSFSELKDIVSKYIKDKRQALQFLEYSFKYHYKGSGSLFIMISTALLVSSLTYAELKDKTIELANNENIPTKILQADFDKIEKKSKDENIPLTDKKTAPADNFKYRGDLKAFMHVVACKESGHGTNQPNWKEVQWRTTKEKGKDLRTPVYIGKYQFGKIAFKDLGKSFSFWTFAKDPSIWPEKVQDADMKKYLKLNFHYLRKKKDFKGYEHYIGKNVAGIDITLSGLLAASHLTGAKTVRDFLRSDGKKIAKDGNKIPLTRYLQDYGGYNVNELLK